MSSPHPSTLPLAELQAAFQAAILSDDPAVLAAILEPPLEARDRLLGVYQNAYRQRLLGAIANGYPLLRALTGPERFQEIAASYIAANVSTSPDMSQYVAGLPGHLASATPWPAEPLLAEMARLEETIAAVFVSADDKRLQLADLGALPIEAWPDLAFAPAAATCRLDFSTNAFAIWLALSRAEAAPDAAALAQAEHIIAYRPEWVVQLRSMQPEEAMMWDEMVSGRPFGELCQSVAEHGGENGAAGRAAAYLGGWVGAGMLAA